MEANVVVFLCRCADNIAAHIDLSRLAAEVQRAPGVARVESHELLCGPEGQEFFVSTMAEHPTCRAVVAACSLREHEQTFQKCLARARSNRYLLAMTNVREHCAWVTGHPGEALGKAVAMTRAAIARARRLEPLQEQELDCSPDLLVVGGGVAGVEAALLAAGAGRRVTIVERSPSLGGRTVQVEDLAPNLECAPCLLAPRLSQMADEALVTVLTGAEVVDARGSVGRFQVTIRRRARGVKVKNCLGFGCEECLNACPETVPNDFNYGLSDRKAVYHPFPGAVPNACAIDPVACRRSRGEDCRACADACPMEAIDFQQEDETIELTVGTVVCATGFDLFQPAASNPWGYGTLPDVRTLAELERLLASDGPTKGQLLTRAGVPAAQVVVVHCVGRSTLGYCSGICCSTALKLSLLAHRHGGSARVTHLYQDLVLQGPEEQALLERVRKGEQTELIRVGDLAAVRVEEHDGRMTVYAADGAGHPLELKADLVVLVTGLVPREAGLPVADLFELQRTQASFLAPDHAVLRSLQTSVDGIFMAGCATGPRTVGQSMAQGHGAAGLAMARVMPGRKLQLEVVTAGVNPEQCSGCLACVAVCPYHANEVCSDNGRVTTNESLCRGCGTCVAACPSGAAHSRHFSDDQLRAEMAEVLLKTPQLLTFVCNWCSYGAADQAGARRLVLPAGVRLLRVMCSGRVDPQLILESFRAGADGVLLLGCHPGDCHYKEGNYRARNRVTLLQQLLPQHGIAPDRVHIDWAGASEGERFQEIVQAQYSRLLELGPLVLASPSPPEDIS